MNLAELRVDLLKWLNEFLAWPSHTKQNWSDYILTDTEWMEYKWPQGIPKDCRAAIDDEKEMCLQVFTDEHEYALHIHILEDDKVIMMGTAYARKPRAGENWNRMNDFTEGEFSEETLKRFFLDIARWEIVAKAKKRESLDVVDGEMEIPPASKTAV